MKCRILQNPHENASIQPDDTVITRPIPQNFNPREGGRLGYHDVTSAVIARELQGEQSRSTHLAHVLSAGVLDDTRCNGTWIWVSAEPPSNRAHVAQLGVALGSLFGATAG